MDKLSRSCWNFNRIFLFFVLCVDDLFLFFVFCLFSFVLFSWVYILVFLLVWFFFVWHVFCSSVQSSRLMVNGFRRDVFSQKFLGMGIVWRGAVTSRWIFVNICNTLLYLAGWLWLQVRLKPTQGFADSSGQGEWHQSAVNSVCLSVSVCVCLFLCPPLHLPLHSSLSFLSMSFSACLYVCVCVCVSLYFTSVLTSGCSCKCWEFWLNELAGLFIRYLLYSIVDCLHAFRDTFVKMSICVKSSGAS